MVAGQMVRGVAICGSGVGASVCANKMAGVHAGLEDDRMNILCMGERTVGSEVACDLVQA